MYINKHALVYGTGKVYRHSNDKSVLSYLIFSQIGHEVFVVVSSCVIAVLACLPYALMNVWERLIKAPGRLGECISPLCSQPAGLFTGSSSIITEPLVCKAVLTASLSQIHIFIIKTVVPKHWNSQPVLQAC